jgi:hypothetical protein
MAPPAGAGTEGRPARRRGTGTGTGTGTSPGRNKVWVEPPGKSHHQTPAWSPPPASSPAPAAAAAAKRVAVVYYLCRNRHLEHPHFIEVPLAAPEEGLYLRGQSAIPPSLNKGAAFRFRFGPNSP